MGHSASPARTERASAGLAGRSHADVPAAVLRFALSAWIGAVVFFSAVVAPAAFRVLPSRAFAGQLAGEALPVLFVSGMVIAVGALLAVILAPHRLAGGRRIALVAASTMLASLFTAQFIIGSRIVELRAEIGGTLDQLPEGDPLRQQFGVLHGYSVLALGLAVAAAVGLLVLLRARRGEA